MRQNIGSEDAYIYKGYWKNGKPDNSGEESYGDGSMYKGGFKDGVKHCYNQEKDI